MLAYGLEVAQFNFAQVGLQPLLGAGLVLDGLETGFFTRQIAADA